MIAPSLAAPRPPRAPARRHFGRVARQARTDAGLTMADVSALVGVGTARVSQIECFTGTPTIDVVRRFANALGLDVAAMVAEFCREAVKPMREHENARGVTVLGKVPGRYPGNVLTLRRYGCHACDGAAHFDAAIDEPMPEGWWVRTWMDRYDREQAAYYCPGCAAAARGSA